MDQYFNQMEKIVKERKTSSRIRFMLQDVIDLRLVGTNSSNNRACSLARLGWKNTDTRSGIMEVTATVEC